MSEQDGTSTGYQPLDDVLQEHQNGCEACQRYHVNGSPLPNLNLSPMACARRAMLIRRWAENEGRVNNIVRVTEHGTVAGQDEIGYNES